MTVQLTNVYCDGNPSLAAITRQVPRHGAGRLRHQNRYGDFYVFHFAWNSLAYYDAFIERQPDYCGRPSDLNSTHRNGLRDGRPRICFWPGKEPRDLPTAIMLAMLWAERTSQYIRDGRAWS
jgi:hypothetical protein